MGNRVKLADWAAVESLMARARNRGQLLTNFFADPERMSEWCDSGSLFAEEGADVTLLWRQHDKFCNLYFFASTPDVLSKVVGADLRAARNRVVADIIGPDAIRSPLVAALTSSGFTQISELVRMSRKTPECTDVPTINILPPDTRDIPDVQAIFREHFNPEVEQLPSDVELERWIKKGGILVHRDDRGKVHSFIIYDLSKVSLYLRYWFVNPQVRGSGVGGHLMRTMFYHARDTKRQYFWVIMDNENAIKRYQHYGFNFEPMKDVVLAKDF